MSTIAAKRENTQSENSTSLLSAADCARICQISRRSWFRLVAGARVPACVRVGALPRWRYEDVDLWIRWNCPSRKEFETRKESEVC